MRRLYTSALRNHTAACAASARSMSVFSEQHNVLRGAQSSHQYKSNVWIEEWETKAIGDLLSSKVKAGQKPITVVGMEQTMKFVNASQLETTTAEFAQSPTVPTSMVSKKPYGNHTAMLLENEKMKYGHKSQWWVPAKSMKKMGLKAVDKVKPFTMFLKGKLTLYNADQFEDPAAVEQRIISGATRVPYMPATDIHSVLKGYQELNGFRTGLFFTESQIRSLRLVASSTAHGAMAKLDHASDSRLYNLTEVEGYKELMDKEGRVFGDTHTYYYSGKPLSDEMSNSAENLQFEAKEWLSKRDIDANGLKLIEGAVGIEQVSTFTTSDSYRIFNVDELEDPALGFTRAGLIADNSEFAPRAFTPSSGPTASELPPEVDTLGAV